MNSIFFLNVHPVQGPGATQGRGSLSEVVVWLQEKEVESENYEDMKYR